MTTGSGEAEHLFERLSARFLRDPSVSEGTGFGSNPGLRVRGKIFAMLVRGELVVKLPKETVDRLVGSGTGTRFDPGHGRLMKEWAAVPVEHSDQWQQLADEALVFVGSAARKPRRG